jgi:hypothetical protein
MATTYLLLEENESLEKGEEVYVLVEGDARFDPIKKGKVSKVLYVGNRLDCAFVGFEDRTGNYKVPVKHLYKKVNIEEL